VQFIAYRRFFSVSRDPPEDKHYFSPLRIGIPYSSLSLSPLHKRSRTADIPSRSCALGEETVPRLPADTGAVFRFPSSFFFAGYEVGGLRRGGVSPLFFPPFK